MTADAQLFDHPNGLAGAQERQESLAVIIVLVARSFADRLAEAE